MITLSNQKLVSQDYSVSIVLSFSSKHICIAYYCIDNDANFQKTQPIVSVQMMNVFERKLYGRGKYK